MKPEHNIMHHEINIQELLATILSGFLGENLISNEILVQKDSSFFGQKGNASCPCSEKVEVSMLLIYYALQESHLDGLLNLLK